MAQSSGTEALRPQELIDFLTYRRDRAHRANYATGSFGCVQPVADFQAATALRRHGANAARELEAETGRMLRNPSERRGWYWITSTYAAIRGRDALPLLQSLAVEDRGGVTQYNVDSAIAISLSLTSFVSTRRPVIASIPCIRGFQPRDALDRVILGVLKGDRRWLESGVNLDPEGYDRGAWDRAMAEYASGWVARPVGEVRAIGYRFDGNDIWSDPPLVLDDASNRRSLREGAGAERFTLRAKFYDGGGSACGEMPVPFRRNHDGDAFRTFVVERDGIEAVLGMIRKCAG
jgi:hypothetical protein